jgi:hypothetical protein
MKRRMPRPVDKTRQLIYDERVKTLKKIKRNVDEKTKRVPPVF